MFFLGPVLIIQQGAFLFCSWACHNNTAMVKIDPLYIIGENVTIVQLYMVIHHYLRS